MNSQPNFTGSKSNDQKILAAVDSLAQLLLDLYIIQPSQEPSASILDHPKLNEAFRSLTPLLLPMINHRVELLPQVVSQIFLQKIPYSSDPNFSVFYVNCIHILSKKIWSQTASVPYDENMLRSIEETEAIKAESIEEDNIEYDSNLSTEEITKEYLAEEYLVDSDEENINEETKEDTEENLKKLIRILEWAFPGEAILTHWPFRSFVFDAYLPRLRIGLQLGISTATSARIRLWLKRENIRIFWVNSSLLEKPLLLKKLCTPNGTYEIKLTDYN